ncbi:Guanine nucleotide-binding protein subunit gamma [Yarrowia sp. C11]|nr:Guanine nucleotide-binding protein subunit gamma [Yarrowia sp. C11]KAG5358765.1 Guanine nucleotide-binding protein subunit gamma [Yarrowia sp. E02]
MSAWSPETDIFSYSEQKDELLPRDQHDEEPMSPTAEYAHEFTQKAVQYGSQSPEVSKLEMTDDFAPSFGYIEIQPPTPKTRQEIAKENQNIRLARLRVKRYETAMQRLQEELDRDRLTAQQAGMDLIQYTTSVKDHAIPELWGPIPLEKNPYAMFEEENKTTGCCIIS